MANFIHPTAIIYEDVEIGDNNYIGAYCIIGAPPEHKKHWDNPWSKVIIGNNNNMYFNASACDAFGFVSRKHAKTPAT